MLKKTLDFDQRFIDDLVTATDSGRQQLAFRLLAERQEQQPHEKRQRCQRDGSPDGVIVSDAGADQKSYTRAGKTSDRSGEGKRAGPALSRVCSGSQSVYMAKLAPPMPRKNRHIMNQTSACV